MCQLCEQPLEPGAGVCHSCGSILEDATDIVPRAAPPPCTRPNCPNCQVALEARAQVCRSCGSLLI